VTARRVFLYGSPAGREVVERLDPALFTLAQFVGHQSMLSSYSRPVTAVLPPPLESRLQQRLVRGDFASSLESALAATAGDVDLLLVDLVDEQLGVHLLPDGSVITRTPELVASGFERALPAGTRTLRLGDPDHFRYWCAAVEWLAQAVQQLAPRARTVLLDIPWAYRTPDGTPTPPLLGIRAHEANAAVRPYVARAVQVLGAEVVGLAGHDPAAAVPGEDAITPVSLVEDAWRTVAAQLTALCHPGARGRAVDLAQRSRTDVRVATATAAPPAAAGDDLDLAAVPTMTWRLRRADGSQAVEPVRLLRGGRIWGHSHPNEARWAVEDGLLVLLDVHGTVSTRFETVTPTAEGPRFTGPFVLDPSRGIIHVLEPRPLDWDARPRHPRLTRNLLADAIREHGWEVGDHTHGRPDVRGAGRAHLSIGRFCTLADTATIVLGGPAGGPVSTYAFAACGPSWPSAAELPAPAGGEPVRLGHDVWLGDRAVILPGVAVGHGAVVQPGAVVGDDVEPYAVVSGAPASVVGHRFPARQVAALLRVRWWDWDDEYLDTLLPLMAQDVDFFLDAALRP
jgi:acetyltransferase-like isoleucine patch superfamily enzyme